MAVMKRAYRKKPTLGFCANPEALWTTLTMETLDSLEKLLRWFHFSCKHAWDALPPQSRIKVLGNVDVKAAERFATALGEAEKNTWGNKIAWHTFARSCFQRRSNTSNR